MKNSVLTRKECVNMFYLDGREVEALVFTKEGKEFARCRWFNRGSNNPYKAVYLPFEVKKRIKHPAGVEAYCLNSSEKTYTGAKKIYIYIPVELLQCVEVETHISGYKSKMDERYFDRLLFVCEAEKYEYIRNDVGEVKLFNTGVKMHRISVEYNNTSEPTELGRKCAELAEVAQQKGINGVTAYTFRDMLDIFDISVK